MDTRIRVGLPLLAFLALSGCSKHSTAVDEAIKSLRKIETATRDRVNHADYLKLLVNAKTRVNDAGRQLPDGVLKDEINAAVECYVDASLALQEKAAGNQNLDPLSGTGIVLINKYQLIDPNAADSTVTIDLSLKKIWTAAEEHLRKAELLSSSVTGIPTSCKLDA
jgi:hypothetical protein